MAKAKLYKIKDETRNTKNEDITSFLVGIFVYAFVLIFASYLFRNLFVSDYMHAIIAALILSILNTTIKPILIYFTLPLTIITYGIAYPLVNMIILKLCDIFMGPYFEIHGFISTFFIAIFISVFKIILDSLITKRFGGR